MYSLVIVSSEKSYFTIASLLTHSLNSCDRLSRHNVPNDSIPIRTSPFAKEVFEKLGKRFQSVISLIDSRGSRFWMH